MNYQDSIKKILVGLIIIVAVASVVTLVATIFINQPTELAKNVNMAGQSDLSKVAVTETELPGKLPKNLPLELNSVILQNFTATTANGEYQATRAYESSKSLAENLAIYTKYLNDNGWGIKSTINDPMYKKVSGTKGASDLQISMTENEVSKIKTITVTYTELP